MTSYKYFAFISYSHKDEYYARWLQRQIENYRFPVSILREHPEMPQKLRPTFRDETEFSGGVLSETIKEGLSSSEWLIVICSKNANKSKWVSDEVNFFISQKREDYIIPVLIEESDGSINDLLPTSLQRLFEKKELICVSFPDNGKEAAMVKIIAQMVGLSFEQLWQRFQRQKRKLYLSIIGVITMLLVLATFAAVRMSTLNRLLLTSQSRAIAFRGQGILESGDADLGLRLALEALDRSYTPEAEKLLRDCFQVEWSWYKAHDKEIYSISYSPDGQSYVTSSFDNRVKVWNSFNGAMIGTDEEKWRLFDAKYTPDGKKIISVNRDGQVFVRDAVSMEIIDEYMVEADYAKFISVKPSGESFLTLGNKEIIDVSLVTGDSVPIDSLFFDTEYPVAKYNKSNSDILAYGGTYIYVLNPDKTKRFLKNTAPSVIKCGEFSPQCDIIAYSSSDEIVLLNYNTSEEKHSIPREGEWIRDLCFSRGGDSLFIAYKTSVVLWDIKKGRIVKKMDLRAESEFVNDICLSPSSDILMVADYVGNVYKWRYNLERDRLRKKSIPFNHDIKAAVAKKGDFCAIWAPYGVRTEHPGCVWLYDIDGGEMHMLEVCDDSSEYIHSVAFDEASDRMVISIHPGKLKVIKVATGEILHSHCLSDCISPFVVSKNGKRVYGNFGAQQIVSFDLNSGELYEIGKQLDRSVSLDLDKDGKRLYSACYNGFIITYDTEKRMMLDSVRYRSPIFAYTTGGKNELIAASLSDKGRRIDIISPESGAVIQEFEGHTDYVYSARIFNEGKYILSASGDGTVRVWSTVSPVEIARFSFLRKMDAAYWLPAGDILCVSRQAIIVVPFDDFNYLYEKVRSLSKGTGFSSKERQMYLFE